MAEKRNDSSYSSDEKRRILQELDERRKREQKAKEAIKAYLSDKKIYTYKGKEYYKVKDYKQSFYVPREQWSPLPIQSEMLNLKEADIQKIAEKKGLSSGI